jgi:hypothetical protein
MRTAAPRSSRLEIILGRSLAACVHPEAAWRTGIRGRIPVVVGYVLAGYLLALLALVSVLARPS